MLLNMVGVMITPMGFLMMFIMLMIAEDSITSYVVKVLVLGALYRLLRSRLFFHLSVYLF